MHYYFYNRLKIDFNVNKIQKNILSVIVIILSLLFFASQFLKRIAGINTLSNFGQIWFGTISISISFLMAKDFVLIIIQRYKRIINSVAYISLIVSLVYASWNASLLPEIKKITLKNAKLSSANSGFTIIQLADLHINESTSTNKLQLIVDMVNKINPDLIVITGDLIDSSLKEIKPVCEVLKKLRSRNGVYAVTGNHEFYTGIKNFIDFADCAGIKILSNESILIAGEIQLAGINDNTGNNINSQYGADLNKTLKNIDRSKPAILLSHKPLYFEEASASGIDLELSGHVHKGQFPPAYPLIYLMYKYPYGLNHFKKSFIYTTSGTLTWGPLMRLFSKNEIVKIILVN